MPRRTEELRQRRHGSWLGHVRTVPRPASALRPCGKIDAVMTVASQPPDLAGIVARLRAAGCVFAEDEAGLLVDAASTPTELAAMVDRRVAGHPLEQVLGWAEFAGLRILLEPGVFVPRRRTELLVREAAAVARAGCASSSTCAAGRARSVPRCSRRVTGSSCTPSTSTRPRCAAPVATSRSRRRPGLRR